MQLTPDNGEPVRGEILRVVSDTKTPVVLEIPTHTGVAVTLMQEYRADVFLGGICWVDMRDDAIR